MIKNKICLGLMFGLVLLGTFLLSSHLMKAESEPTASFTNFFDSELIESLVFQKATLSDFCEVDSETKECSLEPIEVISGYAILKYSPEVLERLSKEKKEYALNNPEQYLDYIQSSPFSFFVIDNELYIGGISGGYAPSSNREAIIRFPSGQSGVVKDMKAVSSRNWEYASQVLLNGLSLQSQIMFEESAIISNHQIQNYSPFDMFYLLDFKFLYPQKELIPGETTKTQVVYPVDGVKSYKEYKLVEVKNSIIDFEVMK